MVLDPAGHLSLRWQLVVFCIGNGMTIFLSPLTQEEGLAVNVPAAAFADKFVMDRDNDLCGFRDIDEQVSRFL